MPHIPMVPLTITGRVKRRGGDRGWSCPVFVLPALGSTEGHSTRQDWMQELPVSHKSWAE